MAFLLIVAVAIGIAAAVYARLFFKRYVLERQERRRAVALFSRYVPEPVVDELLARKDARLFEAREYYATILCAKIRNFALFSEKLGAEETLRYLNEFYTVAGQAVERHHGMIESLRGDTVTAVFGVLVEEQFQEERALRAALDIMRVAKAMEARWAAEGRKALSIGIGVNSGKIVAGDTGFQHRREFAIVGNPAHVAAQLQAASEELNATIVASESTYNAVRDLFVGVPTSSLPLRGLRRLHSAYIIRGLTRRGGEESSLRLPRKDAFRQTTVYQNAPDESVEPDAYIAPESAPVPAVFDRHVSGFGNFERNGFSLLDDSAPALPEPPPVLGTYEDDEGPPVRLQP